MEKEIKKHKPSKCPLRNNNNGIFGCTDCMPITNKKESSKHQQMTKERVKIFEMYRQTAMRLTQIPLTPQGKEKLERINKIIKEEGYPPCPACKSIMVDIDILKVNKQKLFCLECFHEYEVDRVTNKII